MEKEETNQFEDNHDNWESARSKQESQSLVRLIKPIVKPIALVHDAAKGIDTRIVSPQYYNAFNYPLLSREQGNLNFAIGIASANPGEGKSLAASNLAVSLALATQRKTIIADLNVYSPRQHRIFGTKQSPGLLDALQGTEIRIFPTEIEFLHLLPAGNFLGGGLAAEVLHKDVATPVDGNRTGLSLVHAAAFRDVVHSLKAEFDFVIVDMPAVNTPFFPLLLTRYLDGIVVVVDSNRTKQEDIQKIFQRFMENQIHGFIFNRAHNGVYG